MNKLIVTSCIFLMFFQIVGVLVLTIPNSKYLNALNYQPYYLISVSFFLLILILLMIATRLSILKLSRSKALILLFVIALAFQLVTILYFYSKLPSFTYEEAAYLLLEKNPQFTQIYFPEARQDKIILSSTSNYFSTFKYFYNIYLTDGITTTEYYFDPFTAKFTQHDSTINY